MFRVNLCTEVLLTSWMLEPFGEVGGDVLDYFSVASSLGLHYLLTSHKMGARLIWVKTVNNSYSMDCPSVHRGSYMSAHVLLNLLNEMGKKIKCEACREHMHAGATRQLLNGCAHVQEIIHSLKLVDYPPVHTHKIRALANGLFSLYSNSPVIAWWLQ